MQEMTDPGRQSVAPRDRIDEKILALLVKNARMSATALARDVGLSRTSIQDRIARLERDGVIEGYSARIAPARESKGTGAILSVSIRTRPCAPVLARLRTWPEITACYSVSGAVDAVLVVRVDSLAALSRLVDRLSGIPGIGHIETATILE